MLMKTVDLHEAQTHLAELVSLVRAGVEIILTEGNTPIARLVPVMSPAMPRLAGLHLGAILVADDFDEPLPDEFWTGMNEAPP